MLFIFRVREDIEAVFPESLEDSIGDLPQGASRLALLCAAFPTVLSLLDVRAPFGRRPGRFRADSMIRVLTTPGQSTETLTFAPRSASS